MEYGIFIHRFVCLLCYLPILYIIYKKDILHCLESACLLRFRSTDISPVRIEVTAASDAQGGGEEEGIDTGLLTLRHLHLQSDGFFFSCSLLQSCILTDLPHSVGDEELDEHEGEQDEDSPKIGAMPVRTAKIKTKVKPIPNASSFFVFSPTNK